MNVLKRKKKHLSTVRTSRLIANLIILAGFLLLFLGIAYPVLPELIKSAGLTQIVEASGIEILASTISSESESSQLNWANAVKILGISLYALFSGYLLKLLSALLESQIIDLHA